MTNNSMQYLVIQGRAPQDGSEPAKALILCPAWMSATLVCAGITGRIIEMTDGSIVEGRVIEAEGGEEELLAEIRREFEGMEPRKIGMPPEMAAPYSADSVVAEGDLYKDVASPTRLQDCDDAYRKGAEAERNNVLGHMSRAGMPPNTRPLDWVENLVKDQKNLDAWRDAAGAAGLCVEYDDTGMVRKIFTPAESGGGTTSDISPALNALLLEFGGTPGGEYLDFLRAELGDLAIYREQAAGRDLADDVRILQETIDKQEQAYDSLREQLQVAHRQLLERPTVMSFTGPVTINTTEVVVPE